MPPLLNVDDCPPISIITLVHNRPQFIKNACLNLLSSDYPREKMEWVVVDDSEPDKSPSDMILQFEEQFAPGRLVYIPLTRQRSIGYKRNLGVEKATANVLLMMDDDDHYPSTSFRRRVAYLLKGRKQYECATCTMIAMYDLMKGQSAVNIPPYGLSLAERCSEATLTFTRNFWKARPFPDVSVAEGEEFLKGRCGQVVEMPPQQIIVAMNHNTNSSSRRGLPNASPSCFWGFERPLLEFLHGLVGIKVEAE
jgi:glycosyltransferase involved in cell wall biosynthesis